MIRAATEEDSGQIASIYHHSVHQIMSRDYNETQVLALGGECPAPDKWKERQKRFSTFVFIEEQKIRGFIELENQNHIGAMFIDPQYTGKGVASSLLNHVVELAKSSGCTQLFTESSITALPFFTNRQWELIEEQHIIHNKCEFKNFRIKRNLNSNDQNI